MNRKMELDLSQEYWYVCGSPLVRDIKAETERCVKLGCDVRDVVFSIPYKEKKE